ncbi:hypothetical protein ARTHRO9AX_200056 [Arthrobacter sp. 9AX]|nr:hypothetical protein ARTHRO9AX_200056 [Arthrobacter sp. 9AX]
MCSTKQSEGASHGVRKAPALCFLAGQLPVVSCGWDRDAAVRAPDPGLAVALEVPASGTGWEAAGRDGRAGRDQAGPGRVPAGTVRARALAGWSYASPLTLGGCALA